MTKVLGKLLLLLAFSQSISGQSRDFLIDSISDLENIENSNFLVLDIAAGNVTKKVAVTSGYLFQFLRRTRNIDRKGYESLVFDTLYNHRELKVDSIDLRPVGGYLKISSLKTLGFRPIYQSSEAETVAKKGCSDFILKYFDSNLFLKREINASDKNAIIEILFKWNIGTFISDYSGNLAIKKNTCKS